jgi:hypothetical protein
VPGEDGVVEADDGQALRNADTRVGRRLEDGEGEGVRETEDRGGCVGTGDDVGDRRVQVRLVVITAADHRR